MKCGYQGSVATNALLPIGWQGHEARLREAQGIAYAPLPRLGIGLPRQVAEPIGQRRLQLGTVR